jgi:hypothetical protein
VSLQDIGITSTLYTTFRNFLVGNKIIDERNFIKRQEPIIEQVTYGRKNAPTFMSGNKIKISKGGFSPNIILAKACFFHLFSSDLKVGAIAQSGLSYLRHS